MRNTVHIGDQMVPAELRSLIPEFLKRRDHDITELSRFIKEKDMAAAHRIGHKLKGNGAGYGFPVLSALGEEICLASDKKDVAKLNKLLDELTGAVRDLKASNY